MRDCEITYIRNIQHAILFGLCLADMVIADLTGSNANVAYELGIATALSKERCVITQNKDLPWDMKDMRTIFYGGGRHTPDLVKLERELSQVFKGG